MVKPRNVKSAFHRFINMVLSENGGGSNKLQQLAAKEKLSEEEVVLIQLHVNAAKANQKLDSFLAKLSA